LASLQPGHRDRWMLRTIFKQSVENYASRRCKIMDEIWDIYLADHAKLLMDVADQKMDEMLDKMTQQNQQQKSGQQGQSSPSSSSGQGSGSGDGQGQPGEQTQD